MKNLRVVKFTDNLIKLMDKETLPLNKDMTKLILMERRNILMELLPFINKKSDLYDEMVVSIEKINGVLLK